MATVSRAAEAFGRSLDGQLDHIALRQQASAALRRLVGFDMAVWAVVDPATLMWASCVLDGMERDEALENEIFANEYHEPDLLKLVDLAEGDGVGALGVATAGDPAASPRYREILAPRGFTDELRVLLSDGSSTWGAVCLYRTGGRFGAEDLDLLQAVSRPTAGALRSALLRSPYDGAPPVGPVALPATGLLLTRPDGTVVEMGEEARLLLGGGDRVDVPQAVQAAVARRAAGQPGSALAPTRDGRWLAFHATRMASTYAVVVEQVRPHQLADLVVRAHGLTPRERQVLEQLARGRSNRQIARALSLSEWTVQDHVKAVLAKFGATSRSELIATLFFEHYAPAHAADTV